MKKLYAVSSSVDFVKHGYWLNVQGMRQPVFLSNSLFAEGEDDIDIMIGNFLLVNLVEENFNFVVNSFEVIRDQKLIAQAKHTLAWQNLHALLDYISPYGYEALSYHYEEETGTYSFILLKNGNPVINDHLWVQPNTSVVFLADFQIL